MHLPDHAFIIILSEPRRSRKRGVLQQRSERRAVVTSQLEPGRHVVEAGGFTDGGGPPVGRQGLVRGPPSAEGLLRNSCRSCTGEREGHKCLFWHIT